MPALCRLIVLLECVRAVPPGSVSIAGSFEQPTKNATAIRGSVKSLIFCSQIHLIGSVDANGYGIYVLDVI